MREDILERARERARARENEGLEKHSKRGGLMVGVVIYSLVAVFIVTSVGLLI